MALVLGIIGFLVASVMFAFAFKFLGKKTEDAAQPPPQPAPQPGGGRVSQKSPKKCLKHMHSTQKTSFMLYRLKNSDPTLFGAHVCAEMTRSIRGLGTQNP